MPCVIFAVEMRTSEDGGVNFVPAPRTTTDMPALLAPESAADTPAASAGSKICVFIESKSLRDTRALDRMRAIRTRNLAAQPRRRKHLSGIADAGRGERAAYKLHRVEVVGREHPRHVPLLGDADAVSAGEGSARLDAVSQ